MRSLLVLPNLPVPIRSGQDLRALTVIDALSTLGSVAVFGLRPDQPAPPPPAAVERWSTSTDTTLAQHDPGTALQWLADPDGSPGDAYFTANAGRELAELQATFRPDLVVIAELRLHRYVDVIDRTRCFVVLDMPNIEAALTRRIADLVRQTDRRAALLRAKTAERLAAVEADVFASVDQTWVCSDADKAVLDAHHPGVAVSVVPNTVDLSRYAAGPPVRDRLRMVFPGLFSYPPNEQAAMTLIEDVLPAVRTVEPSAELVLVGSHPTPRLVAAVAADGVVVRGVVDNIAPELASASVMPVPLTVGSGTRYKILEAFASRLPVVTTAVGAEGLSVEDGVHAVVVESAEEFVAAILRLWTDLAFAARLATNAHDFVARRYSYDVSRVAAADAVRGRFSR